MATDYMLLSEFFLDELPEEHPWRGNIKGLIERLLAAGVTFKREPGTWEEWWPGDCALIMTGEEKLYRCSICDAKYPDVEGFNFCPHCGNTIESKSIKVKIPYAEIRSYGERKDND